MSPRRSNARLIVSLVLGSVLLLILVLCVGLPTYLTTRTRAKVRSVAQNLRPGMTLRTVVDNAGDWFTATLVGPNERYVHLKSYESSHYIETGNSPKTHYPTREAFLSELEHRGAEFASNGTLTITHIGVPFRRMSITVRFDSGGKVDSVSVQSTGD